MLWQTNTCYEFGPFRVDTRERRLLRNHEVVPLTPKVFDILVVLLRHRGHLVSKDEVMKLVWPNTSVEEGNITRNISTLRSALGERPREHQYIETVPWRGYRFVAHVIEVPAESSTLPITSIAILPLINVTNDEALEYLADGVTEALINNLAQFDQLKVMARNAVFRYKGLEADARVVGRELNVEAVLFGRFAKYQDLVSLSIELVNTRDNSHIWGGQYARKPANIFDLQRTITDDVTRNLHLKLNPEQRHRTPPRHSLSTDAYHCYLKGRYYFNKLTPEGVQRGIEYFKQAIEIDPSYALAYAGLGDCYNYWAKPTEAKEAMGKALEIDDTLGEVHASLGFFKFIYDWDFDGAEKQFARALRLAPNYGEAHHWSAIYFGNMGHHEQAAVEAKLAVELDPLSLLINMTPGLTSYLARNYRAAVEQLLKVIEMDGNFPAAHSVLGNAYLQQGLFENAMTEYEKVLSLAGNVPVVALSVQALMGHAYAKSGQRSEAMRILNQLKTAYAESEQTSPIVSPHFIAEIHTALGQKDLAFEWLDKAYEQHDMQMVSLKVNPTLDPLRDDTRFTDLLRRMGLD